MKRIIKIACLVGFVSAVPTFCMTPATAGALVGASIGSSAGTFIVLDEAHRNPLFCLQSREGKIEALANSQAVFTVAGYTVMGAGVGAAVGEVEGVLIRGATMCIKFIANDIKDNGIRSASVLGTIGASVSLAVVYALRGDLRKNPSQRNNVARASRQR